MGVVRLFHLLSKGNQVLFICGKELISFLCRANVRAFHENPNRIHTEPLKRIITKCMFLSSTKIFEAS